MKALRCIPNQDNIAPVSDRLHIGNKWMGHSGLNWYDNAARMHDPILMSFTTPDPLFKKYPGLSPWSHCGANPLNAIDPDGQDICVLYAKGKVGHIGLLIQNKDGKWAYYSRNAPGAYRTAAAFGEKEICSQIGSPYNATGEKVFDSPEAFMKSQYNYAGTIEEEYAETKCGYHYTDSHVIETTPEQDKLAADKFTEMCKDNYHLTKNNCSQVAVSALEAAGINIPTGKNSIALSIPANAIGFYFAITNPFTLLTKGHLLGSKAKGLWPKDVFDEIKKAYPSSDVKKD